MIFNYIMNKKNKGSTNYFDGFYKDLFILQRFLSVYIENKRIMN